MEKRPPRSLRSSDFHRPGFRSYVTSSQTRVAPGPINVAALAVRGPRTIPHHAEEVGRAIQEGATRLRTEQKPWHAIELTDRLARLANEIGRQLDVVLDSLKYKISLPAPTAAWLSHISDSVYQKLVNAEWIEAPTQHVVPALGEFLSDYLEMKSGGSRRSGGKMNDREFDPFRARIGTKNGPLWTLLEGLGDLCKKRKAEKHGDSRVFRP